MKLVLASVVGSTLANPDGTVRSLNPDGPSTPTTYHWETRPKGTASTYEFCTVNGNIVTFNPLSTEAVSFLFVPSVPNWTGCAFCETPLE